MTINGIDVDDREADDREDPSRDFVSEAGRIARGEQAPGLAYGLAGGQYVDVAHLRALVDEVGGALLELSDWMREHTGPADGTVEILTRARAVLARLEPS